MEQLVSAYILVKGRVQGVGFRYYVTRLAVSLGLNGYVRNLTDGNVAVEVEGEREIINKFVGNVKDGVMSIYIVDLEINWNTYKNKYGSFSIRF